MNRRKLCGGSRSRRRRARSQVKIWEEPSVPLELKSWQVCWPRRRKDTEKSFFFLCVSALLWLIFSTEYFPVIAARDIEVYAFVAGLQFLVIQDVPLQPDFRG